MTAVAKKSRKPKPPDLVIHEPFVIEPPPQIMAPLPKVEVRGVPAEPVGLVCRKCGCSDFRVYYVRHKPNGRIQRKRLCRHCGTPKVTWEQEAFQ